MDQRQKDLLSSTAPQLADEIDFGQIVELIILANLVSREKVGDIVASVESNFSRNLKLLDALQESDSPEAFSGFIRILEYTDNTSALKMISPKGQQTQASAAGEKSVLTKLLEKFGEFKLKRTQYPIGMNSGVVDGSGSNNSSRTTEPSSLRLSSYQDDNLTTSSPLKSDHHLVLSAATAAAALIRGNTMDADGNGSGHRGSTTRCDSGGGFRLGRNNGIHGMPLVDLSPVVPPATSQDNPNKNRGAFNTRQGFIATNNQYSQTPTRSARDTNFMYHHNRSVSDNEDEMENISMNNRNRDANTNTASEPLVCWHPYAHERTQPQSGGSSSSNQQDQSYHNHHRASSPASHCCLPSYASSESDSSSDSFILDSNLIKESSVTMALARDGVQMMKVQEATNCPNLKEDYKMTAQPRGPCLIVNNIDFEGDIFPTRKGSDEDSQRFDNIFQQLGFTVIMRRNQTADQMRDLFKKVAAKCKQEHDALFVFVLSHGSEHGVYGTDGLEVSVENEILPCFDNKNCKAMRGKPKVFVIQACRGRANDFGSDGDMLDSIAWPPVAASPTVKAASQDNRVPSSWLPSSQPSDGKKRKHPIRSDMLIVYPCLAGYVSVRNELRGSWLGVAMAYFILLHAHERDLMRILNLVTSDVIQRESSTGHIQAIELKLYGWTKNLYFNPGIYEETSRIFT